MTDVLVFKSDDNVVLFLIKPQDIQRLFSADAQSFPLPDGIVPKPFMSSQNFAVFGNKMSGFRFVGEHDAPAKKVRAADTNKSHYPHRLVMGVDGMTCQNCQRHVENALNTLPDTLAEVNLSARNVTVWTKADADEEVIRKAIRDAGYLPLRTKEKV